MNVQFLCLTIALGACTTAHAALFPKIYKEVPPELRGEYALRARVNPDKSNHDFGTNAPLFAIILSNRVVMAEGTVRPIEGVIRVKQKGTNVFLLSFPGKASWIVLPGRSPSEQLVLQGNPDKPKEAPNMMLLVRKSGTGQQTNAPPRLRQ